MVAPISKSFFAVSGSMFKFSPLNVDVGVLSRNETFFNEDDAICKTKKFIFVGVTTDDFQLVYGF